jgi:hypothetical protein
MFSYYWAESRLPTPQAADFASRSVAAYCNNFGQLPFEKDAHLHQVAWKFSTAGVVQLEGAINTIGQRYTMEEARFALKQLGVEVSCPALGSYSDLAVSATLIIADGIESSIKDLIEDRVKVGNPIVILCQDVSIKESLTNNKNTIIVDDFSSSLYFAAWLASGN